MDIATMMKNEIDAAVAWWSQQLQETSRHKTGDAMNDAFVSTVQNALNLSPLSVEQIRTFEETLRSSIITLIEESGLDLSDPLSGSYHRVVSTDYGPEDVLAHAAGVAHITYQDFRFPMKTIMWIDPGRVLVRSGYGGQEVVIYPKGR